MDNGLAVKDQGTEAEAYERIRENSEEIYSRMQRLIQPTDIIPAINNAHISSSSYWLAQLLHTMMLSGVQATPEEIMNGWISDLRAQTQNFHVLIIKEADEAARVAALKTPSSTTTH